MEIQIGHQTIPLTQGPNGRFQASFTADKDTSTVLIPSDCIGTLHVDDIQLEEGEKATSYVEPEIYTSEISGIFKDLKDLNLKIEDTELGLKTQIRINQSGLEQRIEDTRRGLESRLIATADTWQSQLKDTQQGLESQISQTASLWQSQLKNADANLRSVIQQTADSLVNLVEDTDSENFSKTEQLVSGLQSTVSGQVSRLDSRITSQVTQLKDLIASSIESATGEKSEIWQTLNAHNAQITNAQGDISRITQRVDSVQSQIRTVDGKQSTLSQTVTTLQGKVEDTEKKLRSTIQQTSDNIITLIEETDSKNLSKTEQLVNGMQSTVQGEINRQANRLDSRIDSERSYTRSQVTQLKDLISSRIESSTGDQSDIWQTMNSLGGQISSARGDISRVDRRVDSVQSRISSVEGDQSRLTQTVNSLDSRISNTRGDVSRLTQTVDGLSYDVRNSNGLLKTEIRNLAGQIDAKVTRGDVQSIIRSSGDSIWFAVESRVRNTANNAKMSGREIVSEINVASGGVRIKGSKIHLSGSTIIDRGVIRNDMIANGISANKITTGTLNANNVRVINLDVNSLSGNKARFVQLGIQGISRNIELDGRGIHIYRNDGSRSNLLSEKGIEFWRDGREHGQMSTLKAVDESGVFRGKYSISLAAEDSAYISLSYRKRGDSKFTRAIGINGENGNVHMNTLFPDSDEDRGLKFTSNRIWNTWGVQIWNSRPNNGGLLINDNGDVEIISGELFFRTWRAYNHSNAGTNGLELRAGRVGGQWGLFLEHTNSYRAGIFFGHNGHVYIRDTNGTYSQVKPNFN